MAEDDLSTTAIRLILLTKDRSGGRWLRIATAGNGVEGAQVAGIGVRGVISFASLRRF
jgi:hypothetical protein